MAQRGLGRGLESLIPVKLREEKNADRITVPLSKIRRNHHQPRKEFKESSLKELAETIRSQGLIQPIMVKPVKNPEGKIEEYELIAGERRWRACQIAGLTEVPVNIKEVTDREQLQLALVENLQREDLNPIEEANAYKKMMDEFELTQEELSRVLGKTRTVIANTLRLLNLPQSLQNAVLNGTISAGHARNLVSIDDENLQKEMAEKIVRENLTVRDIERMVSEWKGKGTRRIKARDKKDAEIKELEDKLQQILGTRVEIKTRGKGKTIRGSIKISYFSLDDLERLAEILSHKKK